MKCIRLGISGNLCLASLNIVLAGGSYLSGLEKDNDFSGEYENCNQEKKVVLTEVEQFIKNADYVIEVDSEGRLAIGIGFLNEDDSFVPTLFSWEELRGFYEKKKNKKLLVLKLHPLVTLSENAHLERIYRDLVSFNFDEVVVIKDSALGGRLIGAKEFCK